jgi:predicted HTH domain antitoxin
MATISIEIPDEILESFKDEDEIRKTIYEDFVIEQRQNGNISLGKAAELLGITYSEFFNLVGNKGLSYINASKGELEESYNQFEKMMES